MSINLSTFGVRSEKALADTLKTNGDEKADENQICPTWIKT